VAQLVRVLRYRPARRGIVSLEFFFDIILPAAESIQTLTEINTMILF
jgi:hypothetical protein